MVAILFSSFAYGTEDIKVVVVDTGFKENSNYTVPLCSGWHYDATTQVPTQTLNPPLDTHGHGTHIAGIIHQFAQGETLGAGLVFKYTPGSLEKLKSSKKTGYCLVIVKYYNKAGENNAKAWTAALQYIRTIPGNLVVNFSGGGVNRMKAETEFVQEMLKRGNRIIAAAGNENSDMSKAPKYYPAMEPGVTAVGAFEFSLYKKANEKPLGESRVPGGKLMYAYKMQPSNYGSAKIVWRVGELYSGGLNNDIVLMVGTSQAAAMQTGLVVRSMLYQRRADELRTDTRED
jgi:subtilisin family serine protease